MTGQDFKKLNLPDAPGVYFFKKSGTNDATNGVSSATAPEILYIGRATSLRDRVKSYFADELIHTRGPLLIDMVTQADTITWEETGSVLEAIILENNLIKEHQPRYNTKEKDNRSYNYIVITEEEFPRVLVVRGRNLEHLGQADLGNTRYSFGPYPYATVLRDALRIIRKMFPFRDTCTPATPGKNGKPCFNHQLGLCPGVCDGSTTAEEYALNIRRITLFLQGKTSTLLAELERDMRAYAREQLFEKANDVKKTIYALSHIQDMALIKKGDTSADLTIGQRDGFRIEAYDVAHLGGKDVVGVMTVIRNGMPDKTEYRKFRVKRAVKKVSEAASVQGYDDVNNLKEILTRRFARVDWPMPDLIVVDGGLTQKKVAEGVVALMVKGAIIQNHIPVVSVVKDDRHVARDILGGEKKGGGMEGENVGRETYINLISTYRDSILLANHEAHRFAITYHKLLRKRAFLSHIVKKKR